MKEHQACQQKPRGGKYSDKNGSYEQVLRVKRSVIKPGETLEIEQFFTGYGQIRFAKMCFYMSDDVFDEARSHVLGGLVYDDKTGRFSFGREKFNVYDVGKTFGLVGATLPGWEESTLFFDVSEGPVPQILTETKQINAPFLYNLTTLKLIRPGTYYVDFYFTYFNGDSWKSSGKKLDFKVQNFFERNDKLLGGLAVFGTVSALLKLWILPLLPSNFIPGSDAMMPKSAAISQPPNLTKPAAPPTVLGRATEDKSSPSTLERKQDQRIPAGAPRP